MIARGDMMSVEDVLEILAVDLILSLIHISPSEILYQQKPHLGTDQLVGIVQFMRHQIEEMGGEFRFRSTVSDLMIRDRKLTAVIVNAKEELSLIHI